MANADTIRLGVSVIHMMFPASGPRTSAIASANRRAESFTIIPNRLSCIDHSPSLF